MTELLYSIINKIYFSIRFERECLTTIKVVQYTYPSARNSLSMSKD